MSSVNTVYALSSGEVLRVVLGSVDTLQLNLSAGEGVVPGYIDGTKFWIHPQTGDRMGKGSLAVTSGLDLKADGVESVCIHDVPVGASVLAMVDDTELFNGEMTATEDVEITSTQIGTLVVSVRHAAYFDVNLQIPVVMP